MLSSHINTYDVDYCIPMSESENKSHLLFKLFAIVYGERQAPPKGNLSYLVGWGVYFFGGVSSHLI